MSAPLEAGKVSKDTAPWEARWFLPMVGPDNRFEALDLLPMVAAVEDELWREMALDEADHGAEA